MESMGYEADSLVFSLSSEDLLLVGSASLQYGRMGVSADTIRYESNGELVTAMGNMELTEAGETATGTGLVYHMPTQPPEPSPHPPSMTGPSTQVKR